MFQNLNLKNGIWTGALFAFLASALGPLPAQAQELVLPAPGAMVHLSPAFNPPVLKGIKVHPGNPFQFDFILDKGQSALSDDKLKEESNKLIKYFLASLTIPEKDLWVNLSPYEKDRIVPESFGETEMGRDLLAQDYLLKQITASLIYPEDEMGKQFWKRVYEESAKKFGTTNVPANTFNKVWILPDKAVVYENVQGGTAYVVESRLKVMLEEDYLARFHNAVTSKAPVQETSAIGSRIVREVIIPQLTREVNEGRNFARLRQVYNSLILATWYKKKIKGSILSKVYADRNKTPGLTVDDLQEKQKIYRRYLQAFKKGVYNYIKEEWDPVTQQSVPRKYFLGGMQLQVKLDYAMASQVSGLRQNLARIMVRLKESGDRAKVLNVMLEPSDPIAVLLAELDRDIVLHHYMQMELRKGLKELKNGHSRIAYTYGSYPRLVFKFKMPSDHSEDLDPNEPVVMAKITERLGYTVKRVDGIDLIDVDGFVPFVYDNRLRMVQEKAQLLDEHDPRVPVLMKELKDKLASKGIHWVAQARNFGLIDGKPVVLDFEDLEIYGRRGDDRGRSIVR